MDIGNKVLDMCFSVQGVRRHLRSVHAFYMGFEENWRKWFSFVVGRFQGKGILIIVMKVLRMVSRAIEEGMIRGFKVTKLNNSENDDLRENLVNSRALKAIQYNERN